MALASSEFLTSERAVSNRVFTGRGGGIGIFIDESNQSVILDMIDCKLHGNFARSYGGGIYILLNGYGTQHVLTFTRVNIVRNTGGLGGAGVQLSYLSATDSYVPPHTAVFRECNFEDNIGEAGGGLYVFTSFIGAHGMYFRLDGCNFTGNRGPESVNEFGAAVVVSLFTIFQQRVTAERHDIVNCTFSGNTGRNGIVSIGYSPIRFSGTNNFINNSGASVRIVGSLVDFFGDLSFINNTDTVEGALSLLSFGQMRVNRGLHINFNGNKGRLGAAITVTTPGTSTAFLSLLYNSACFATYEDTLVTPTDWEDVNIDFQDNSAVLASALYLSRIGECSWFSQNPPYFRHTFLRDWPIWNFGNNTNTGYSDSHSVDHYVGTLATEITANIDEVTSWPGERYQMSISGIDEFNQVTSTNARLFQVTEDTPSIKFNPEIVVVAGSFANGLLTDEFPITYSLKYEEALLKLVNQSSLTIGMGEPFETLAISAENFTIRAEVCPGGYQLMSDNSASSQQIVTCQCLDIPEVVECEDDQDSVIIKVSGEYQISLRDSYWAGYVEAGTPNLFFHPCPPGYCQCSLNSSLGPQKCVYTYTHSNQDLQCTPEREGILCGSCKAEYGLSVLLNKCVSCSNGYITLLIVLVFADILALTAIALIDRPLPQWLYPLIFYVQISPYVSEFFPESFDTVGVYMTYMKSAMGFYFVYDFCLLNSLPPIASYFIRYIPSITAFIVCLTIQIVRKYFLKMKSLNHHGYWLIVILLYPQLVHTSISLLNCPQLPDSTGRTSARWFVDASVQCFSQWHMLLTLFSIAALFICFTSIIAFVLISVKIQIPAFFKKFIPSLVIAYKEECKWWSGVELGRRLLLLVLLISFPRNNVYSILSLVFLLAGYSYLLPYKSRVANAFEVILLFNLIVLMLLDATPLVKESLFLFEAGVEVSPINWLLFSFYYLPILLLVGLLIGLAMHKLLNKCRADRSSEDDQITGVVNPITLSKTEATSQIVHIDDLDDLEEEDVLV
ncbi:uncharacterized protein LOC135343670 isoform X3 [Halichondria panicea]